MKKRITTIVFILLLIGSVVWMITEGTKAEVLPIGGKIPEIKYRGLNEVNVIRTDSLHKIIVMFFSVKCPHCEYELSVLNKNVDKIKEANFYLITSDKDILTNGFTDKYPELKEAGNIKFGVVNKEDYKNKYGEMVTPSFYFFDKNGKLFSKLKGETKIERILKEINKVSVSRVKSRTRDKTEKSGNK